MALALSAELIRKNLIDTIFIKKWCQNFSEFKQWVLQNYSIKDSSRLTGVKEEIIQELAAKLFNNAGTTLAITSRG